MHFAIEPEPTKAARSARWRAGRRMGSEAVQSQEPGVSGDKHKNSMNEAGMSLKIQRDAFKNERSQYVIENKGHGARKKH